MAKACRYTPPQTRGAVGEGMLIHPSPDSQDRKGNLVSRRHFDCLNMSKKWPLYRCVLSLPVIKARNSDGVLKSVRLLTTKNPLSARFFVALRIAFVACARKGCGYCYKGFRITFRSAPCGERPVPNVWVTYFE